MSSRHLAVAFGFLTRIPVPDVSPVDDEDLRQATAWFPVVGLVIGAIAGLGRWLLDAPLGGVSASVVAVALGIASTGAFHEDGWSDMFDGLWGGWTPERRIEIMRDSRIGVYGGAALILALLLQVSLLSTLDSWRAGLALVAAHTIGRGTILVQIRLTPAVSDQGSGAKVADPINLAAFMVALLFSVGVGWLALGPPVAIVVSACLASTLLVGAIARHKIGGATGDVLGATVMASLLTTLLTAVTIARLTTW